MKHRCKAVITYEFIVEADTPEAAEQMALEGLADDVVGGTIRTDIFPPVDGCSFPTLDAVEVK